MMLTLYPELDSVLSEVADHASDVLGDDMVGAYLEGSFALGAGDPCSDVDFIVVMKAPLDPHREGRLRTANCRPVKSTGRNMPKARTRCSAICSIRPVSAENGCSSTTASGK